VLSVAETEPCRRTFHGRFKSSDKEIPDTDWVGRVLPTAGDKAKNVALTWFRSDYGKAFTDYKVPPLPGHKPPTTTEEGSTSRSVQSV